MSYKTNPITNRLKIVKGWKNSSFPVKTLNYSREMVLWFKVYLFLKAYFSLHNIRLLTCEIRISDKNTKVLYLSVNKDRKEKKKNTKSKWIAQSFLYALKSPLTKVQTQNARFLLYQDLKSLKKISFWARNSTQKKIFSKTLMSKNRHVSWVNFAKSVSKVRKKVQFRQQLYSRQKFLGSLLFFDKFQLKSIKQHNLTNKFWINKQRQTFSLLMKIQKEVFFIEKTFNTLANLNDNQKSVPLEKLLHTLTVEYENKKHILTKLQQTYHFFFHSNLNLPFYRQEEDKNFFTSKIHKQQTRVKIKLFWLQLKKELISLKRHSVFFTKQPQFFLIWKKKLSHSSRFCVPTNLKLRNTILSLYLLYGPKIREYIQQLFPLNKKNIYWTKYMLKGFLLTQPVFQTSFVSGKFRILPLKQASQEFDFEAQQKKPFYSKTKLNSLLNNIWKRKFLSLTRTRLFTRKKKLFSWQSLRLIRFQQKRSQKLFHKKKYRLSRKAFNKHHRRSLKHPRFLFRHRNKIALTKKIQYRLPYRREYKNQLKIFTNWRIKYLIQDFIQQYFAIRLHVKLIWPLAQFKNLKFYRLIFSKKPSSIKPRLFLRTKIHTKSLRLRKRYVFISQVTNNIRLQNLYRREKKKYSVLKKIKRMLRQPSLTKGRYQKGFKQKKNVDKKKYTTLLNNNSSYQYSNFTSSSNQLAESINFPLKKKFSPYKIAPKNLTLKLTKKNAYLSHKLKKLKRQSQKRLHWAAKARFMSNLVTTLTLFAKYLDPQPLADILAKVIGNTKKHVSVLKLVETVLKTLNLKRGVGYRIALTGRANGANKSHVIYLNKLKRNRPRQTFSKNVNFALAHARASIGTFGIKIWVYS